MKASWQQRFSWVKITRPIIAVIVTAVIVFALLLNLARVATPLLKHYHANFEHWVENFVHRPVEIGTIQATWSGFEPALKLGDVRILTSDRRPFLTVKHFTVAIDLWSSFWHRRWLPGRLGIDGLDLEVRQDQDNKLHVAHDAAIQLAPNSLKRSGFNGMIEWLLTQTEVRVKNVNILWHGTNGFVLPMQHVRLEVENSEKNHHIIGTVQLAQAIRSSFHFIIDVQSDQVFSPDFSANVFVNAHQVALAQWAKASVVAKALHGLHVMRGDSDVQFWGQWRAGRLQQAQAAVKGQHLALQASAFDQQLVIPRFTFNSLWQRQKQGWQLSADKINMVVNHHPWRENQLLVHYQSPQGEQLAHWQVAFSYLKLDDVQWLLTHLHAMPPSWRQDLITLQPRGELHHTSVSISANDSGMEVSQLSSGFNHVQWHALKTVPSVSGLTGSLSWSPQQGHLHIDSSDLTIGTHQWLNETREQLKQAQLGVAWRHREKAWRVDVQQLHLDDGNAVIQFQPGQLHWQQGQAVFADLHASFRLRDLSHSSVYVPKIGLEKPVRDWLQQAFEQGAVRHGAIDLTGPLQQFPFDKHHGDLSIHMEVDGVTLRYDPMWPAIKQLDGELRFHDRQMVIEAGYGETADAKLHHIRAEIPDLAQGHLQIRGDYAGTLAEAQDFLQQTPLDLAKQLKSLQLEGIMNGKLRLDIPLATTPLAVKLAGSLQVKQGAIMLPDWNTAIKDINGRFDYTDHSCKAKRVTAHLLHQPMTLSVNTLHREKQPEVIQVAMGGHVDLATLQTHYHLPQLGFVHGGAHYRAMLNLYPFHARQGDSLSVMSDLQGLAVDVPAPLGKLAKTAKHFYTRVSLAKDKPVRVMVRYGKKTSAHLSYRTSSTGIHFDRGELRIGSRVARLPRVKGLSVAIKLPYANGREWQGFYQRFKEKTAKSDTSLVPRLVDLRIMKLIWHNLLWNNLHVRAQPLQKGWFAQIHSQAINGELTIPQNPKGVWKAEFQTFDYTPLLSDHSLDVSPMDIPAIDFTANEMRYKHRLLGHVHALTQPFKKGVKLKELSIKSPQANASVRGEWTQQGNHQQVISAGSVRMQDWGLFLRRWNYTDVLSGGFGMVGFQLGWPGTLSSFKLSKASGEINAALRDGRIMNLSKSTQNELGLGKFLNILSMQSLPRRLVLNFGDFSEKGFPFDLARGSFDLKKGVASTNNLSVEGSLADVNVQGDVGLVKKNYDLHMQVKPKITGSIPFIATVTGGPLAGAIAWVADKLFVSRTVARAAMVRYNITGSWDHPSINKVS